MTHFWKNGQFWQFCGIEVVLTQVFLSSLGGVCTLVLNLENLLFDVLSALKINKLPQKKDFQCNEINQHFVVNVFSKYQWNLEVERFKQMNSLFSLLKPCEEGEVFSGHRIFVQTSNCVVTPEWSTRLHILYKASLGLRIWI